jgi:hypothetical protein
MTPSTAGSNRLTPQTLKAINDMVVQAAVALGMEDGAKLRVDTTVVDTDIHHPPDNNKSAQTEAMDLNIHASDP